MRTSQPSIMSPVSTVKGSVKGGFKAGDTMSTIEGVNDAIGSGRREEDGDVNRLILRMIFSNLKESAGSLQEL